MDFLSSQISTRLEGILQSLSNAYNASTKLSNSSKGYERELFISGFLSQIFPPHFRFSSGDIIDTRNNQSGQVDIVLEYPEGFSFPLFPNGPRLFLAENVAAVLEIKSNLNDQWHQVEEKARKTNELSRRYLHHWMEETALALRSGGIEYIGPETPEEQANQLEKMSASYNNAGTKIPFYVVGFEGWKSKEIAKQKLASNIDGILVINQRYYVAKNTALSGPRCLIKFLEGLEKQVYKQTPRLPVLHNYVNWNNKTQET